VDFRQTHPSLEGADMEDTIEITRLWEVMFCGHSYDNKIEGYEHYRHTLAYIEHQFLSLRGKGIDPATLYGYKSKKRFFEKMREWITLRDPVPLKFLKLINADLYVLETALSLDRKDYDEVVKGELIPKVYVICRFPLGIKAIPLTGVTGEKEAIAQTRSVAVMRNTMCLIEYPYIKTIWIEPDGQISVRMFPPKMTQEGKYIRFSFLGDMR